MLAEWAALRAHGALHENKLSPDTLQSYVSALRSVHVDRGLPTDVFEHERLQRIINGIRRATPFQAKKKAAPLTPDILTQVTHPWQDSLEIDNVNLDAAFKVAFAGFLRSGEFLNDDRLHQRTAEHTKLTRADVTFAENDEHVLLRLKRSKTDTQHKGIEIVLAATGSPLCPVHALRRLWILDPQPLSAPLFHFQSRSFSYSTVVPILQERLCHAGIPNATEYRGHSFRRGAAQHASNIGILDAEIQALGRWSSQAFKAYYKTVHTHRFNLSWRFSTGQSLPLRHTT
jgi:integrase